MHRVFVSGPTGCIGAATVAYLLDSGVSEVIGFSRNQDLSRIPERYHERLTCIPGDISDASTVRQSLQNSRPTHIIHLAAYQTPDCQAYPFQGLDVNVTGTINMLRAAAELDGELQRFVFASSAAVYGARDLYETETVGETSPYQPPNLYGYWKVAGEGMAQAFHRETGVATVALRLATTYGPGRDRGLTSAPTSAIKSVARGIAYQMPYQGREHYHYVADVGAGFAQAAVAPFSGYGVFNLRGRTIEVIDFLTTVQQAAHNAGLDRVPELSIAADAASMPFVCDLDDRAILAAFPDMPLTSVEEGVRRSLR
ncbi:MAG: NAD(P)-dependent oxidoreductase, partial [Planctomycetaceae bacterium]